MRANWLFHEFTKQVQVSGGARMSRKKMPTGTTTKTQKTAASTTTRRLPKTKKRSKWRWKNSASVRQRDAGARYKLMTGRTTMAKRSSRVLKIFTGRGRWGGDRYDVQ